MGRRGDVIFGNLISGDARGDGGRGGGLRRVERIIIWVRGSLKGRGNGGCTR